MFIYALPLEIQFTRGEVWGPINRFKPTTFVCLSQARTWISWSFLCSVSSVKMRGGCSFCWCLWNWWLSLSFQGASLQLTVWGKTFMVITCKPLIVEWEGFQYWIILPDIAFRRKKSPTTIHVWKQNVKHYFSSSR